MPDTSGTSLTGCKAIAALVKTALANAEVHLFKSDFNPSPASTAADFAANECDYDGYADVVVASWADPVLASGLAGYLITGGLVSFPWVLAVDAVGDLVGGYWVQEAGGTLMYYVKFGTVVPVQGPDQTCEFVPVYILGTGV